MAKLLTYNQLVERSHQCSVQSGYWRRPIAADDGAARESLLEGQTIEFLTNRFHADISEAWNSATLGLSPLTCWDYLANLLQHVADAGLRYGWEGFDLEDGDDVDAMVHHLPGNSLTFSGLILNLHGLVQTQDYIGVFIMTAQAAEQDGVSMRSVLQQSLARRYPKEFAEFDSSVE